MRALNQWLERDVRDRHAEMRAIAGRVDDLRDLLRGQVPGGTSLALNAEPVSSNIGFLGVPMPMPPAPPGQPVGPPGKDTKYIHDLVLTMLYRPNIYCATTTWDASRASSSAYAADANHSHCFGPSCNATIPTGDRTWVHSSSSRRYRTPSHSSASGWLFSLPTAYQAKVRGVCR